MTNETAISDETGLEVLEHKITRAVELIHTLRDERNRLMENQVRLETQIAEASALPREAVEELTGKVMRLEGEKAQLLVEKREMTRRIEAILAKLEFLESESVPR